MADAAAGSGIVVPVDWAATFPVITSPQRQEAAHGLISRVDAINGWPSGVTARFISRRWVYRVSRFAPFLASNTIDWDLLAQCLSVTRSTIERTTFRQCVDRLYGPEDDYSRLGVAEAVRVCPACIAGSLLIRHEHAFPVFTACLVHEIELHDRCMCGAPLKMVAGASPFHCSACARFWGTLPQRRPAESAIRRNAHAGTLLATFVNRADEETMWRAAYLIHRRQRQPRMRRMLTKLDRPKAWIGRPTLNAILSALVESDIRADDYLREFTRSARCPNRRCEKFDDRGAVRHDGRGPSQEDQYACMRCGTHFTLRRVLACFDRGGCQGYSDSEVDEWRARLRAWTNQLAEACRTLSETSDQVLEVDTAFRAAGLPASAFLRADELGLTDVVRAYAAAADASLIGLPAVETLPPLLRPTFREERGRLTRSARAASQVEHD